MEAEWITSWNQDCWRNTGQRWQSLLMAEVKAKSFHDAVKEEKVKSCLKPIFRKSRIMVLNRETGKQCQTLFCSLNTADFDCSHTKRHLILKYDQPRQHVKITLFRAEIVSQGQGFFQGHVGWLVLSVVLPWESIDAQQSILKGDQSRVFTCRPMPSWNLMPEGKRRKDKEDERAGVIIGRFRLSYIPLGRIYDWTRTEKWKVC